jgi:hypothetical protein
MTLTLTFLEIAIKNGGTPHENLDTAQLVAHVDDSIRVAAPPGVFGA